MKCSPAYILPTIVLLFLSFSPAGHLAAGGIRMTDTGSQAGYEKAFSTFANDPALRNANWSFYLSDIHAGKVLLEHNSHRAIAPASTQKLVTTISALLMLGPTYTYHTGLLHDGRKDASGVLRGNLYIRGSGDPSLGAGRMHDTLALEHVFAHFLQLLKQQGITSIAGHVLADESAFDQEMVPRKWLWEDMGNYFGAGSSGLTVNENEYTVFFQAGRSVGDPATVAGHEPVIPGMSFLNQVRTGPRGSGDRVYIFGAPYIQERLLTGSVPLGSSRFPVRGSMAEPPLFFARAFRDYLVKNGIEVTGQGYSMRSAAIQGITYGTPQTRIGEWVSPPLFEIVFRTNVASVNTYAENLLKTIGKEVTGQGTTHAGANAIRIFWEARGVDMNGMVLQDGSGLSPSNRITARQLGHMLEQVSGDRIFPALYNSLPVAGFSGSLAGFFHNTSSEGILRAKSGYLGNVRAYAGYTTLQNGNLAAFVLIVNDYGGTPAAMRDKMFQLMDTITGN
jgi:serine-type D-Ala-D-Ala carboxypeptidase/endopeptidase (penicillin-binding protein 4)